jgi:hypothetical protein
MINDAIKRLKLKTDYKNVYLKGVHRNSALPAPLLPWSLRKTRCAEFSVSYIKDVYKSQSNQENKILPGRDEGEGAAAGGGREWDEEEGEGVVGRGGAGRAGGHCYAWRLCIVYSACIMSLSK